MNTYTVGIGRKGCEVWITDPNGCETVKTGFHEIRDALAWIDEQRSQQVAAEPRRGQAHSLLVRMLGILGLCNW
jgi:hypothetical protein